MVKLKVFCSLGALIVMVQSISELSAHNIIVSCHADGCSATVGGMQYRCSVGRHGLAAHKVEGDGCTPVGSFPLRQIFFRSDKIHRSDLKTALPVQAIKPFDGWCDAPQDSHYNQLVHLNRGDFNPLISHEKMMRDDDLYDIVVVVGYNDQPPVPGKGSAIFIHVARKGYTGTAGCIAFSREDLMAILPQLDQNSMIQIKE